MSDNPSQQPPLIVGITGASGAIYAQRMLRHLSEQRIPTHLVISQAGAIVIKEELGLEISAEEPDVTVLDADPEVVRSYNIRDFEAPVASGTFPAAGMMILPCSTGTLGAIASGISDNLIRRAAEVMLKERRRLVLVLRETPLNLIHLENCVAVTRAGAPAVGLTGADDRIGLCRRASPYRALDGSTADLGLVGQPLPTEAPRLLDRLRRAGYTPIVACIGVTQDGQLLNVNADMLAAQLAVNLEVSRLIILGATAGVLDSNGHSLTRLDDADVEQLVASGDITAGMVAKLDACRLASRNGVDSVIIADGRRANDFDLLPGTVITAGGGSTNPQAPAVTENTNKKGDGS